MTAWHESCTCHGWIAQEEIDWYSYDQLKTFFNRRLGTSNLKCMMCSRRAPELAAGDFQVFVEELIDLASVEVLAIISEYNLSPT